MGHSGALPWCAMLGEGKRDECCDKEGGSERLGLWGARKITVARVSDTGHKNRGNKPNHRSLLPTTVKVFLETSGCYPSVKENPNPQ